MELYERLYEERFSSAVLLRITKMILVLLAVCMLTANVCSGNPAARKDIVSDAETALPSGAEPVSHAGPGASEAAVPEKIAAVFPQDPAEVLKASVAAVPEDTLAAVPDRPAPAVPENPAVAVPDGPVAAVPGNPAAAVPDVPAVTVPGNPAAAVPDGPAVTVPKVPAGSVSDKPAGSLPDKPVGSVPDDPAAVMPQEPEAIVPEDPSVSVPDVPAATVPPEDTAPGTATGVTAGFLVNESGIIYGISDPELVVNDGYLEFPDEGCMGIAAGTFGGGLPSVREIFIPDNITYIEEGAFSGLTDMEWFEMEPAGAYYTEEGVLFSEGGACLLAFPAGRTGNYKVPSHVGRFAAGAFDCARIEVLDATACTLTDSSGVPENISLLVRETP